MNEKSEKVFQMHNPCIYKDDSIMKGVVASAILVSPQNSFIYDYTVKLHIDNSIYQAELFSIYKAIEGSINSLHQEILSHL